MRRNLHRHLAATAFAVALVLTGAARADQIVITYSAPGVYTPDFSTNPSTGICASATTCNYGMENFSAWDGSASFNSSFNDAGAGTYNTPSGVSFGGAYSVGSGTTSGAGGELVQHPQDQYGGVSGSAYPELFGPNAPQVSNPGAAPVASYNLALTANGVPGVNYFGLWISALDANNDLRIFSGTNLLAQFNSSVLQSALGNCLAPASNGYCGNPTAEFKGQNSGELFAYVNVFNLDGFITNVQFINGGTSGFESTNHAVGYVDPIHVSGIQLDVPEPLSAAVLGMGLAGLGLVRRVQRRARQG